jgi:putative tryptophan/tyrosine transport system substrate-binding protein
MARRALLTRGLIVGILWLPLAAAAQPATKIHRLGILYASVGFFPDTEPVDRALLRGLREHGYVPGQNLALEFRSAYGKFDRLPELAAELVGVPVDLILVPGLAQARAAQGATKTIPILFVAFWDDPVGWGLVQSFARPGGNVTGLTASSGEIVGKRLELLKETVPALRQVAVLVNPDWPADLYQRFVRDVAADSARLGLQPRFVPARTPTDLPGAFAAMARAGSQAVLVPGDSMFSSVPHISDIAELAAKHRLPGMFDQRESVTAGGLMTYATNYPEVYRRAARYIDRIFKGAKPADLPVEEPTVFDFVINLRAARQLGLQIPSSIRLRATELLDPP